MGRATSAAPAACALWHNRRAAAGRGAVTAGGAAHIELHRRVLPDRCGAVLETAAAWKDSLPFKSSRLPGVCLALMSPAHQIIQCFAHSELAHGNHQCWRLDLRQLHHFAHLCSHYRDEVDWERVAAMLNDATTGPVLGAYLLLAERLLGVETAFPFVPDKYAKRHLSRVIFFVDGRWKWLRVSREIIEHLVRSFTGEQLRIRYPEGPAQPISRLCFHNLVTLFGRYCRREEWKATLGARMRKYGTIG